jgi:hypothetical protein
LSAIIFPEVGDEVAVTFDDVDDFEDLAAGVGGEIAEENEVVLEGVERMSGRSSGRERPSSPVRLAKCSHLPMSSAVKRTAASSPPAEAM